jgi:hypothetical protein
MGTNGNDTRPAALAWYAAFDTIWNSPNADKTKLRADRIEVLKALISTEPFFALRMELVDLLVDSKANDEAIATLRDAASSNFNFDIDGQKNFQEVQARVIKLKTAGILPAKAETDIANAQQAWLKQKADSDQQKVEMKKEEEKAKVEAAANAAKQKAETDKMKAEAEKAKKAAATPGASVKTPPAPGPAPAKGGPATPPTATKK